MGKMMELFHEIRDDLNCVETELRKVIKSDNRMLNETATHLINAGGKRLRPALSLLCGRFYNYDLDNLLSMAVALELIHVATLVHDDVVDASYTRRGIPTIKSKSGNRASVHVGNYLFALSQKLISAYDKPEVVETLAYVSSKMCEGEIRQLSSSFNPNLDIKDYLYRIKRKTALLISASCYLGAIVCGASKHDALPLRRYGHFLGMAFQITDDILDMTAEQSGLGKPVGSDLREGVVTLPVVIALYKSPERKRLERLITDRNKDGLHVQEAIDIIVRSGSIEQSYQIAEKYLAKAKAQLEKYEDNSIRRTMIDVADFIEVRRF